MSSASFNSEASFGNPFAADSKSDNKSIARLWGFLIRCAQFGGEELRADEH